jgi:hypothetical protein
MSRNDWLLIRYTISFFGKKFCEYSRGELLLSKVQGEVAEAWDANTAFLHNLECVGLGISFCLLMMRRGMEDYTAVKAEIIGFSN